MRTVRADMVYGMLFHAGLLLLVGFVLLLPVFPSGDGPVHIYYSQILARLASHQAGMYEQVYFIRHLVQPYSLHYWWLIALEHVTTPAVAEKSFVAAILLVTALGFRFLARTLGHGAPAVSLWVLPLLLSWALSSGFLNFCFAQGMLFFAYSFFLRYTQTKTRRELAGYTASLLLLVLSHPVPLLLLLLLLGCELLLLLRERVRHGTQTLQPVLLCLGLALLAFVFPMLIADKAAVADSLLRDLRPHWAQVRAIVLGYRLSMFSGTGLAGFAFTVLLVLLAPVSLALMVRDGALGRLRRGESLAGARLYAAALAVLLATIIFPASMNGSALFADRMIPLLWPLLLVCAASVPASVQRTRWSTASAVVATTASLGFACLSLLPASRQQAALTAAALPQNKRGLLLTPAPVPHAPPRLALAQQVMTWGGARAFAAHNDILLNSPWMQLTIVPVGERPGADLRRDRLPGELSENPPGLVRTLTAHDETARQALARADFLLYSDASADDAALARVLSALLPASGWQCASHGFYAVCTRASAP